MADTPSDKDKATAAPAPEELKPQEDEPAEASGVPSSAAAAAQKPPKHLRRGSYRPSHKATFIGLAVVVVILAVNAGIIAFVLRSQSKVKSQLQGQVTISQSDLSKLGVNRTAAGDAGMKLTVNPDADFNGNVQVADNLNVAGQLKLNGTFSASSAELTQLQAGNTQLQQLNVNGDGTLSNLALRGNLNVAGNTQLQGPVTLAQLLTVNNSVSVAGNLSIGGTLAVGQFQVTNLSIAGHVTTLGSAPSVVRGSAVGPDGTVSISGNDAAGTVAANSGVGATAGQVACVSFRSAYADIPHVVVTASAPLDVYVSRSASGFCIYAGNALNPSGAGYAFDYIVEQ
ncbi:MAG TPA: hypothetical protein VF261_00710 [Candidatus Saccharimonadales bacterium]